MRWRPVEQIVKEIERTRRQQHTNGVQETVGREQAALFLGLGAFLQEGVEGDDEQSAGKARDRQPDEAGGERVREAQQDGSDAEKGRAVGYQADLDSVSREPSGGDASKADANRQRGDQ